MVTVVNMRVGEMALPFPDPAMGRYLLRPGRNSVSAGVWAALCAFEFSVQAPRSSDPYAPRPKPVAVSYVAALVTEGALRVEPEPAPVVDLSAEADPALAQMSSSDALEEMAPSQSEAGGDLSQAVEPPVVKRPRGRPPKPR